MDDQLERFVLENRASFDQEEPSPGIWSEISKKQRQTSPWVGWWRVAAICFLISTVYLIVDRHQSDADMTQEPGDELAEFTVVEDYYTTLIAQRKSELAELSDSELRRTFLLEIERLDERYAELKETYTDQNASVMLSDAMINNLKLRIDILDQQLRILRELKKQEDEDVSQIEI
ncbi:MAG: hypothetical protein RIC30_01085 [Marinoscillum sp.]|uniref:hypothetical protein n=1 Tax=Marinoscillum sp. TaxID=2024838 RepID=UPI003302B610